MLLSIFLPSSHIEDKTDGFSQLAPRLRFSLKLLTTLGGSARNTWLDGYSR
jgi:hypothetical protein